MLVYNKFENEISLNTVKTFYENKDLFDVAVDAVVRGCVKRYNFDNVARKYFGIVTSFDGNEIYKVVITLDHKTGIKKTACDCPEDGICYHIGALALQSGYDAPIFSYTTDDCSDPNDSRSQPFQEVYVKSETLEPDETTTTQKMKIEKSANSSKCNSNDANISFDKFQIKSEISVNDEADAANPVTLVANENEITNDEKQKSAMTCVKCNKIFDNKFQFEVHHRYGHNRPVHQIPMFQCAICSSRKHTKLELDIHVKNVHRNNECNICGLLFLTSKSKNEHLRTMHEDRKKFRCDKCPRYFFTKKGFQLHNLKNIHHQCKCSICNKAFNRVGHYNRHIRGVHGIEPSPNTKTEIVDNLYECKICSLTFSTFVLHHKHLRTHPTIFQSFKCALCGQGFETKKALNAHEMYHKSLLHKCKLCDRGFNKESDLHLHSKDEHCEPLNISDPPENKEKKTSE